LQVREQYRNVFVDLATWNDSLLFALQYISEGAAFGFDRATSTKVDNSEKWNPLGLGISVAETK
jgi:hypothetical protein